MNRKLTWYSFGSPNNFETLITVMSWENAVMQITEGRLFSSVLLFQMKIAKE